jgi:prepilin-type N-terminal cleavage/methylation domain-containing protein
MMFAPNSAYGTRGASRHRAADFAAVVAGNPVALRRRGFTLIEVLLAVVLSGVIAAAVFGTLAAGRDASRRGEILGELDRIARQALDRIVADVRFACKPSDLYDTGFVGTHAGEEPEARDTLDFVTAAVVPDPARFGPVDAPDADRPRVIDLARVVYAIDVDGSTPESGLVRSVQFILPVVTVQTDRDFDRLEIAPEVVGLRFRYLGGASWSDTWDSRQSALLPQMVEIGVTVRLTRYEQTFERTLRTAVRCAYAPPLSQMDSP